MTYNREARQDKWRTATRSVLSDKWKGDVGRHGKLSASVLEGYGFKNVPLSGSPFVDRKMAYWCRDAVLMFYNEGEGNENSFLAGFGENRFGEYRSVTFRWIHTEEELLGVYRALVGRTLERNTDSITKT